MIKQITAFIGLRIAQCLLGRHKSTTATRLLEKITKFAPGYPPVFFHLGCKSLEEGECRKAICHFKKAIERNPRNSVYHTFLGLALYDTKDYTEAREVLSHSLTLDTNNQLTYNCLALCDLGEGDFENFSKSIEDKGVFESAAIQSRLLLAMEFYRRWLDFSERG